MCAKPTSPQNEHAKIDLFVAPLASLPFEDSAAVECGRIRHDLESRDLMIAAIALANNLVLVTTTPPSSHVYRA